ncbi:MAG: hypothetical protein ACLFVC_08810, partial [Opitutales bacterium]
MPLPSNQLVFLLQKLSLPDSTVRLTDIHAFINHPTDSADPEYRQWRESVMAGLVEHYHPKKMSSTVNLRELTLINKTKQLIVSNLNFLYEPNSRII